MQFETVQKLQGSQACIMVDSPSHLFETVQKLQGSQARYQAVVAPVVFETVQKLQGSQAEVRSNSVGASLRPYRNYKVLKLPQ